MTKRRYHKWFRAVTRFQADSSSGYNRSLYFETKYEWLISPGPIMKINCSYVLCSRTTSNTLYYFEFSSLLNLPVIASLAGHYWSHVWLICTIQFWSFTLGPLWTVGRTNVNILLECSSKHSIIRKNLLSIILKNI